MVIRHHKPLAKQRGALTTEMLVAMAFLLVTILPLSYSFAKEQLYLRTCYQRSIAMEMVDGEMEVLLAGEWQAFSPGTHEYAPRSSAVLKNLLPGKLELKLDAKRLRLTWQPEGRDQGGKVIREAMIK